MNKNNMIYVFLINGKKVEIKSVSQYAAKRIAKRRAGAGNDCVYVGKRREESE